MDVSQLVQRIQIQGIRKHSWFRINYMPTRAKEEEEVNLDDVRAVFDGIEVGLLAFIVSCMLFVGEISFRNIITIIMLSDLSNIFMYLLLRL